MARGTDEVRTVSQVPGSTNRGSRGSLPLVAEGVFSFLFLAAPLSKIQQSKKMIDSAGGPGACYRVAARSDHSRRLNTLRFKCFIKRDIFLPFIFTPSLSAGNYLQFVV